MKDTKEHISKRFWLIIIIFLLSRGERLSINVEKNVRGSVIRIFASTSGDN